MKRAVLIATGTIGSLGAILAVTPPQFGQNSAANLGGGTTAPGNRSATPATVNSQTPATPTTSSKTNSAKPSKSTNTKTASGTATKSQAATQTQSATPTPTPSPTPSPTPTPTPTKTQAATNGGVSGAFTGNTYSASRYGNTYIKVTIKNGVISDVSGYQNPSSWSGYVIPTLDQWIPTQKITIDQIMSTSAENLPCAIQNSCRSRASYTATAYWQSLQSALKKAGF